MNRILTVIFALGLAACATISNPVTQSRVDALDASWGAALALAEGYYETCEKRLIASTCRTVVAEMQRAAPIIQSKVVKARAFAKNPSISATDLLTAASDAVNDFKVYQMEHGVK